MKLALPALLLPLLAAGALTGPAAPALLDTVDLSLGADVDGASVTAYNPTAHRLYALGGQGITVRRTGVKVIDTTTGAVVAGIPLTDASVNPDAETITPTGIAVDSGNGNVYVAGGSSVYQDSQVIRVRFIDGASNTALTDDSTDLILPGSNNFQSMFVDSTTHRLYVEDGSDQLFVIDGASRQLINTAASPVDIYVAANDPATDNIYVFSRLYGASAFGIINGVTGATTTVDSPVAEVQKGVFNPAAGQLLVLAFGPSAPGTVGGQFGLFAVDPATGAVLASNTTDVPYGNSDGPSVVLDAASNTVYVGVSATDPHALTAFDATTLAVKATYSHAGTVAAFDGGRLFLAGNYVEEPDALGILDLATGAFGRTVLGAQPFSVAVNSKTGRVFVLDQSANEVEVIDATSRAVLKRFPLQLQSTSSDDSISPTLAVSATLNRFYVTHLGQQAVPGSIFGGSTDAAFLDAYDADDGSLVQSIALGASPFAGPGAIAVDDAHGRVYVTTGSTLADGTQSAAVQVIDAASNTVLGTIASPTTGNFNGLAVNPVTQRVYASSGSGEGKVIIMDGAKMKLVTALDIGNSRPGGIAVNSKTNKVYIANYPQGDQSAFNSIDIIDGATDAYAGSFDNISRDGQNDNAFNVAVDEATNTVYVADDANGYGFTGLVNAFDATNHYASLNSVAVGLYPRGIVLDPVTRRLFVTNDQDGTVSVLQETGGPVVVTPPPAGSDIFLEGVSGLKVELDSASAKYKVKGSYTLTNRSASKLKNVEVGVYLSTSGTLALPVAANDPALLQIPVTVSPGLDAKGNPQLGVDLTQLGSPAPLKVKKIKGGATYTADFKFKVPAAALQLAAKGPYRYVIVVADPGNQFADGITANNVYTIDLQTAVPK